MKRPATITTLALGLLACFAAPAALRGEEKKPDPVSFSKEVMPFFKDKCVTCHSGAQPMHGFSVDTPEQIMKGGDQGPAIVKGKSGESLMVQYLMGQRNPKMPPNEPVDDSAVKVIRRWIDEGARFDLPAKKDEKKG
jgi:hypothetical protein